MKRLEKATAIIMLLLASGCTQSIPPEHTSLSLDPGENPGPPSRNLSLMWLHHSTGDYILKKGKLKKALQENNISFYDINYNEAVVDGYVIGDHTDPPDFPKNFNTAAYFEVIRSWELAGAKKTHDIIMFKSCFPSSNIDSDAMLEKYKGYYTSLIPTFKKHPNILFIPMSTPPLVKGETTRENAARARQFSKWLSNVYAKDLTNVQVFDLFGALAVLEGKPDENTLVPQFAESSKDSHPSKQGGQAVTRMFIPWLNRTLRVAGVLDR